MNNPTPPVPVRKKRKPAKKYVVRPPGPMQMILVLAFADPRVCSMEIDCESRYTYPLATLRDKRLRPLPSLSEETDFQLRNLAFIFAMDCYARRGYPRDWFTQTGQVVYLHRNGRVYVMVPRVDRGRCPGLFYWFDPAERLADPEAGG